MQISVRVPKKYSENLKGSGSTAVGHGLLTPKEHLHWFEFSARALISCERESREYSSQKVNTASYRE